MASGKQHGGRRAGAGRPYKYGESTQVIRVPQRFVPGVKAFLAEARSRLIQQVDTRTIADIYLPTRDPGPLSLPLYATRVEAGFPSPADDYVEGRLDLNEHLVKHPAATFYVRVAGDSMIGAGIHPGDILVVDRSVEADDGKIVIAVLNGELTVKRLRVKAGQVTLQPENGAYPAIEISEGIDFTVWGVVTGVVRQL